MRAKLHSPRWGLIVFAFLMASTMAFAQGPTLTSPGEGANWVDPVYNTFSWYHTSAGTSTIQIATDNTFSNIVYTNTTAPYITYVLNVTLSDGTTYFWRVKVDASPWSGTFSFSTTGTASNRTITAAAVGGGSITPSGAVSVANGGNQAFTITPNANYHLDSLKVDGALSDSTTHYTFINVTVNHTITAYFSIDHYTITASVVGGGSITPSGAVLVNYGANQAFSTTPSSGYHLDSIRVDGVTVDSVHYTFINVTANHTIVAYFDQTFTITASADAGGSIAPSGAVLVDENDNQAFTITADVGHHLDSLIIDGVPEPDSTTSYTFLNVTADHSIAAYFSQNPYTITSSTVGGTAISPLGAVIVLYGDDAQFTIAPDGGYDFDSVYVDGALVDSTTSYTFLSVAANHTIVAYFSRNDQTYVDANTGDDGTGDGSAVLPYETIQKGIDESNPGQVIHVASGTYTAGFSVSGLDDITIIGAGTGNTNVIPSSVFSTGIGHKYAANAKVVVLINNSTNIELNGLTIESGSAAPDFGGPDDIILWNASTGAINDCEVTGTYTISGTQSGQGIGVDAGTGQTTTLSVTNTSISGFQKNGIDAVDGNSLLANPGTINLTVDGCTITGAGPTAVIAQNGILVWNRSHGNVNGAVNNTKISGLSFTPGTAASSGILAYSDGTPGTNLSSVTNSIITGTDVGIDALAAVHLEIVNNLIKNNEIGIVIEADFSALGALDTPVVITENSIFNNSEAGLDVASSTGGPGAGDFYVISAENNYWGSANGPIDSTFFGASSEMPAGSGNPVQTWVNLTPVGGNEVVDNDTDPDADGVYVDYYPWDTGTPTLSLEDISSTTGATVSMDFILDGKGSSFNTLQGKFTYDITKLDFLNASYGTGTLVNGSGWTVFFSESTPGTVTFAGVGFTPINSDGTIFKLNFEITDIAAGTTDVTGNNADFKANGSQIFGAVGSFDGTVTYTHIQQTYMRGDVSLDGSVTLDDALLLQDKITNANISSLSDLALQNADADLSSGDPSTVVPDTTDIDLFDVLAILQYVIDGNWPVIPGNVHYGTVAFGGSTVDQNGLLSLPIAINDAQNVQTLELTVKYNESAIDYQSFSQLMKSSGNFVSSAKIGDGVASFMYASTKAQNGNLTPGKIILKLKGNQENLNITSTYKLNGGEVKQGPSYTDGVTAVENSVVPTKFEVAQNYPNPFNPTTTIKFGLPEASFVSVKVYDMLGQLVKTLVNEERNAGTYHVTWNGDSDAGLKVTSGAYIYRVVSGSNVQTMKMMLMK